MIAIDGRYAKEPISGISRFTSNLLAGLEEVKPSEPIAVLVNSSTLVPAPNTSLFRYIEVSSQPWSPLQQFYLGLRLKKMGISLLYSPDIFSPFIGNFKSVVTVHDLIPLRYRSMLRHSRKAQYHRAWRAWIKLQCSRAEAVTTVSEHSANDLHAILGVPRTKIHVIYNGIAEKPVCPESTRIFLNAERRILYVGRRDPYKNLGLLVEAFARVHNQLPQARLYIVGSPDSRYQEAEHTVDRLGLGHAVVFTGQIADKQLSELYRSACVFAFPSLCEGFGLPPLEAMQHGVPVVSSNRSAMPEVLGDAAVFANPEDPDRFGAAILQVMTDESLADQLRQRGHRLVLRYTHREQATNMLNLWKSVQTQKNID